MGWGRGPQVPSLKPGGGVEGEEKSGRGKEGRRRGGSISDWICSEIGELFNDSITANGG